MTNLSASLLASAQRAAKVAASGLGRDSRIVRALRPWYEQGLATLSCGQGIPWQINEATIRIRPDQRHRFGPDYDAPVARLMRERLRPGATCFNVGANVGVYVLQMARWSESGRVVAFEPNPVAASILREHIAMNDLEARVQVVPAAVGGSAGLALLHASEADGMSRLGAPNPLIAERTVPVPVPVVTIDDFCDVTGEDPDCMFVDVEGAELEVLEGARRLIDRRRQQLLLLVEMHPSTWTRSAQAVVDALGLVARPVGGQRHAFSEHGIVLLAPQNPAADPGPAPER